MGGKRRWPEDQDGGWGHVSTDNSTFQVLLANATYTGEWEDCSEYASISVAAESTDVGTEFVDFSSNKIDLLDQRQQSATNGSDLGTHFITPDHQFFRVRVSNGPNDALLRVQTLLHRSIRMPISRLDGEIGPESNVINVRSIVVGEEGNGDFENVTVVKTMNDDGTYHSLQVVSGARPSELFGRTSVRVVIDGVTTSSLQYTVSPGKTLFVTDVLLTANNSAGSTTGQLKLEDGVIAAQPVVLPVLIAEPQGSETRVTPITHSFDEPLQFATGIWLNESMGTLTVSGVILGYEE